MLNNKPFLANADPPPAKLNQSQHHDLLLIENKYTEWRCTNWEGRMESWNLIFVTQKEID